VAIGENSLDQLCLVERHPEPGSAAPLAGYLQLPGGQVATVALACARLGLRTAYIGAVGDDDAAETTMAPLRSAGVDLSGLRRVVGAPTRTAVILVHRPSGERTVLAHRDPRIGLEPRHLRREQILRGRVLHLDARDPETAAWAAGVARQEGIAVVLDAERLWQGADALLRLVDFPIVSRGFAEELGGTGSVRDGLRALTRRGGRMAVVTLGERGAIAASGDLLIESPAFRVEVRDTTGAGDAFRAGFIWGLLRGLGSEELVRTAQAVAALNCEALGAQGGLPALGELESFLRSRSPECERELEAEGRGR
jgi:sugar/nucleoside kinase (ribokinase family)